MDNNMIKDLEELCTTLSRSIASANEKIRSAGGKLSTGDTEYIDRLTHSIKSIKAIMKMDEEADMDDGYSERGYSRGYDRGSYRGSYGDGGSYAMGRGRGRYANRDSMGRYSSNDGYSRGVDTVSELREIMRDLPDDQTRQEMQRLIQKMESR